MEKHLFTRYVLNFNKSAYEMLLQGNDFETDFFSLPEANTIIKLVEDTKNEIKEKLTDGFVKTLVAIQKVEDDEKDLADESIDFALTTLNNMITLIELPKEMNPKTSRDVLKKIVLFLTD